MSARHARWIAAAMLVLLAACRPAGSMQATTPLAMDGMVPASAALARDVYVDAQGAPLDGGQHRYTLRFGDGQLPPGTFWSLRLDPSLPRASTPAHPTVDAHRLARLRRDADGGITLYLQRDPPPHAQRANWLPAPDGPFLAAMRYYGLTPERRDARWTLPPIQRTL